MKTGSGSRHKTSSIIQDPIDLPVRDLQYCSCFPIDTVIIIHQLPSCSVSQIKPREGKCPHISSRLIKRAKFKRARGRLFRKKFERNKSWWGKKGVVLFNKKTIIKQKKRTFSYVNELGRARTSHREFHVESEQLEKFVGSLERKLAASSWRFIDDARKSLFYPLIFNQFGDLVWPAGRHIWKN